MAKSSEKGGSGKAGGDEGRSFAMYMEEFATEFSRDLVFILILASLEKDKMQLIAMVTVEIALVAVIYIPTIWFFKTHSKRIRRDREDESNQYIQLEDLPVDDQRTGLVNENAEGF